MALSISSPVFQEGEGIPAKYSCEGQDISLPLAWGEPPADTNSFALIVDDPDAPGRVFTHWVLFNLPADSRELPEAVPLSHSSPAVHCRVRMTLAKPATEVPVRRQVVLTDISLPSMRWTNSWI